MLGWLCWLVFPLFCPPSLLCLGLLPLLISIHSPPECIFFYYQHAFIYCQHKLGNLEMKKKTHTNKQDNSRLEKKINRFDLETFTSVKFCFVWRGVGVGCWGIHETNKQTKEETNRRVWMRSVVLLCWMCGDIGVRRPTISSHSDIGLGSVGYSGAYATAADSE